VQPVHRWFAAFPLPLGVGGQVGDLVDQDDDKRVIDGEGVGCLWCRRHLELASLVTGRLAITATSGTPRGQAAHL